MLKKNYGVKMYQYTSTGGKFKIFIKETNAERSSEYTDTNRRYLPREYLAGIKAKEYYEDILKESSLSSEPSLKKPKSQTQITVTRIEKKAFKNSDLLWMAQNNDINNLKIFFAQNKDHDVNVTDEFDWTPLMCASCSGAKEAVEILLDNGADVNKCDRLGNTALKLARQKNFEQIVQILRNLKNGTEAICREIKFEKLPEFFFCQTCKENFTVNKNKHESSTLHLFNSRLKTSTFYGIPESNKGFQLLLREGWNKEKGLGPDGAGRKFPVKAILKKDRAGIGAPSPLPNKKKSEIQHPESYENKKRNTYKKMREKDFEKKFRLEFSSQW